jgi:hypothetical protein
MKRDSGGFSLVEALVALLLLTLGLLATAPMFVYASKVTASGADMGRVGSIDVRRLEILRASGFSSLTAGGSLTSNVTGYFDTSVPQYTVRWTVADNATPPTVKTVTVRVLDTRTIVGAAKEITLVTLRALE